MPKRPTERISPQLENGEQHAMRNISFHCWHLVVISVIAIMVLAIAFAHLYASTFRGHRVHSWTHGPFNFECGIYREFAVTNPISSTTSDKLPKHFLAALLYPQIHRLLTSLFPITDSPLVCAALGGATILLFGLWLGAKIRWSPIIFPVIMLLGFSFTTWYVSSVWESRAFIMFGAAVLLLSIDRFLDRPIMANLLLCILASAFSELITIGNIYLIPLAPLAMLIRARKIGLTKTIRWIFVYLLSVALIVSLAHEIFGLTVNPRARFQELFRISMNEQENIGATMLRLNLGNYRNVFIQSLVYGIGGLYLPAGPTVSHQEWAVPNSYRAYLHHTPGLFFIIGYAGLIALTLFAACRNGLLWREPLLLIIIVWAILCISFFTYFNPWAGPVYMAELMPPLWAFIGIALGSLHPRRSLLGFLLVLALVVAWNNLTVIRYFKYQYGTPGDRINIAGAGLMPPEPIFHCKWQ